MDPTYIGLAGFLTLALGLVTLGGSDSSDDAPNVDDPSDDPTTNPDAVTIEGTAGDDDLIISDLVTTGPDLLSVSAGAGDDFVEGDAALIHGGEGDDTIRVGVSDGGTYHGDEGDDLLYVGSANDTSVNGGAGNDTIRVVGAPDGSGNEIDGGAGDDIIRFTADLAISDDLDALTAVDMGQGHDTLNLVVTSDDLLAVNAGQDIYLVNVTGFWPGEGEINVHLEGDNIRAGWLAVGAGDESGTVTTQVIIDQLNDAGEVIGSESRAVSIRFEGSFLDSGDMLAGAVNFYDSRSV